MRKGILSLLLLFLCGCALPWRVPDDVVYVPLDMGDYQIATYQRITDPNAPVRIYIEGDGNAFDGRGHPTTDPTPRGKFVRDMMAYDPSSNVVYMARPCQYIMTPACSQTDWTDGRFSARMVDTMADAIRRVAAGRPVILIGYSGGAMISGLVINRNPDLDVQRWITIAGVLNHGDWTRHFGDVPLSQSLDLDRLPRVSQTHYVARDDDVVPNELSRKWVGEKNLIYVPDARHSYFPVENLSFGLLTK